jgi:predicted transcriptional regulator
MSRQYYLENTYLIKVESLQEIWDTLSMTFKLLFVLYTLCMKS